MGLESSQLSNLFKGPARAWTFAGSFVGPIFAAGAISGQVRQAEAGQKAAILSYEQAILSAFSDVENALVARSKLSDQLTAQGELVGTLTEYKDLAWMQYRGGYTPYLTVLNAESQLFPAQLSYAQFRTSLLNAFVAIYKAMGGGWVSGLEKPVEAPPSLPPLL